MELLDEQAQMESSSNIDKSIDDQSIGEVSNLATLHEDNEMDYPEALKESSFINTNEKQPILISMIEAIADMDIDPQTAV
jgi:hypothetical protein